MSFLVTSWESGYSGNRNYRGDSNLTIETIVAIGIGGFVFIWGIMKNRHSELGWRFCFICVVVSVV